MRIFNILNKKNMLKFVALVFVFVFILGDCSIIHAGGFTIRNSPPSTNNKYYYNSSYNVNAGSETYAMPNCTTYVLGRVYEITGKRFEISGNACDYYKNNKKYECSTDAYKPQVGAVVCYSSWTKNKYGHVQVVEKIGSDSKGAYICVSESNYSGRYSGNGAKKFNYMKIYLSDLAASTSSGFTKRTLLEDNDGYSSSQEIHKNGTYTKFQGYIYPENVKNSVVVSLNKSSITLDIGEVSAIQVNSEIPSGKSVTWKSSNSDIAFVMANGTGAFITGQKSGQATITATCGNATASCIITVKGNGNNENALSIKNEGVTKIKENTARINASISPGMIIEEAGFYWGTSKNNLTQVKESVNAYTTTVWYDLGTGKWCKALKPNTTYYYQLYVKANGQTYKTSVSSFKTAEGESYTLTNSSVTNLTTSSARIKATLSPGVKIEKAGFYYGKSSSNLTKKTETVNAYTESVWYDLGTGKWCNALSSNTKYYYQIFVVINGTEYKSQLSSFTTASYKLKENSDKFTDINATDITNTSAKIKTNYPKSTYQDAGFYFGRTADLASMKKTSEYVHGGSPSVSYTNSYKLGVKYDGYGYKWAEPLEAGTKYYYAFYLVLNGTEYISPIKSFTTTGTATIEKATISSYPTKRDYNVGDKIDTTGVKVKVTYSNGETKTITKGITCSGSTSSVGTKQVTLKYEGYSFKYNINVVAPLKSIKLNVTSSTLDVDDVLALTVTYNPTNTTDNKEVIWKSSNTNVATVSNGMVLAVGSGTTTITATCGNKTATCNITVRVPVNSVSLNKSSTLLTKSGDSENLQAIIAPNNAANKNVTWMSSDTSVATVSADGVVKAVGEGITTISATTEFGNITTACTVTVDYPENDEIGSEEDEIIDAWEDDIVVNDSQETTNTDDEESVENTDTEDIFVEDTQDAIVEELLESINTGNVYLIEENEIAEIENLININKMRIVQIKNDDSVTFTFPVGYMTTVEGMEKYDFSTEIISDLEQMKNLKIDAEQCVLRINYNHSGELPGTAVITIPVGTEWSGQKLYYYQVYEDGTCKYTGKCAVVDENGNYSISQAHCSDYILSLAKPAGMVMENEKNSTTEKINDANKMPVYIIAVIIAVVVLAVVGIGIIWLKKNYVMRRR